MQRRNIGDLISKVSWEGSDSIGGNVDGRNIRKDWQTIQIAVRYSGYMHMNQEVIFAFNPPRVPCTVIINSKIRKSDSLILKDGESKSMLQVKENGEVIE